MKRVHKKSNKRKMTKIRSKVVGSKARPRLSVFRSNKYIYVQAINDDEGKTVAHVKDGRSKAESAGKKIGEVLKKSGVKEAVFDRGGYKYHGSVKKVADSIRESGIKF